ncbi:MAG: DUF4147 domain-containing protein [Paracoccaceae bacterium]
MPDLHHHARTLFQVAVDAADPARALRPHLAGLPKIDGRYIVIAFGKAAIAMTREALRHLQDAPVIALAVTNYENIDTVTGCTVMAAGHPVPDANGEKAGQAVIKLLQSTTKNDLVVALISGGGSALLPAPLNGISLADKAAVSRLLLGAGFDITKMNAVRQHLSCLKGGGLARLAAPAPVHGFILSDVIGDDLRVVASGPTLAPIATRATARAILQDHKVFDKMPTAVQNHFSTPARMLETPPGRNTLIGSNRQSLRAVQGASMGVIIADDLTGDVSDVAEFILKSAQQNPAKTLIFGGETTVKLKGAGKGGRNQELALRLALLGENIAGGWVFLSAGTDGRDGPTDAAGAIVDAGTPNRIRAQGLDPLEMLQNNDSYTALKAAGDLLITGATGTNVADVQVFLRT